MKTAMSALASVLALALIPAGNALATTPLSAPEVDGGELALAVSFISVAVVMLRNARRSKQ